MVTYWIEVSMIGFGICLSTAFFLRSSFLKRKNARKLEEIQKNMENGLMRIGHQIDLVECHLQQVTVDFKASLIPHHSNGHSIEEKISSFLSSILVTDSDAEPPKAISPPPKKRGRPPKASK